MRFQLPNRSISAHCWVVFLITACALWTAPARGERIAVSVSILPLKQFVERVGGAHVEVSVMVGQGQSPAIYAPTAKQMARLAAAEIFFRAGVPFEQVWMDRLHAANPNMRIVDLRSGIVPSSSPEREEPSADDLHHPGGQDPHLWTSPPLVKRMGMTIFDALAEADPANRDEYHARLQAFLAELDDLDARIRIELEGVRARRFLVFHPAWAYFADTYGLEQIAIEHAGKEPGPRSLARLIEESKAHGTRVVFVQRQFSTRLADTVARAIGARVVVLDPLAEDYFAEMLRTAQLIGAALR
jgi:zinc transport system substrate-binding protein